MSKDWSVLKLGAGIIAVITAILLVCISMVVAAYAKHVALGIAATVVTLPGLLVLWWCLKNCVLCWCEFWRGI